MESACPARRLALANFARRHHLSRLPREPEGVAPGDADFQFHRRWRVLGFNTWRPGRLITVWDQRSVLAARVAIRCRRLGASPPRPRRESRPAQRRLSRRYPTHLWLRPPSSQVRLLPPLLAPGRRVSHRSSELHTPQLCPRRAYTRLRVLSHGRHAYLRRAWLCLSRRREQAVRVAIRIRIRAGTAHRHSRRAVLCRARPPARRAELQWQFGRPSRLGLARHKQPSAPDRLSLLQRPQRPILVLSQFRTANRRRPLVRFLAKLRVPRPSHKCQEVPCKSWRVTQRRFADLLAHLSPNTGELIESGRPLDCQSNVTHKIARDKLAVADVRYVACRVATCKSCPRTRNHRHTHPQRLARCQPARIRLRVECQIDLAIAGQGLQARCPTLDQHPIVRHAAPRKFAAESALGIRLSQAAVFEQQPGGWYGPQDLGPGIQYGRRIFCRVVEAAESHLSGLECRQRGDRWCVCRRTVADVVARHAEDRLGVPALFAVADMKAVGNQAIHRCKSRRAYVSQPSELQRRRSMSKSQQPPPNMSAQIDEHIDLILSNLMSQFFIRKPDCDSPDIGNSSKSSGVFVRRNAVEVTRNRALLAIETFQSPQAEKSSRALAEIKTNETNP